MFQYESPIPGVYVFEINGLWFYCISAEESAIGPYTTKDLVDDAVNNLWKNNLVPLANN
jgi:hypothetical protein